jgi:replicative DNA helicase
MVDISILKLLLSKDNYNKHRNQLEVSDFSKDLQGIVRTIDAHFKQEDSADLSVDDLSNLYFSVNRRDLEFFQGVFDNLKKNEANEESIAKLIGSLRQIRLLRELSLEAYEAAEGRTSVEKILDKYTELGKPIEVDDGEGEADFVSDDLVELVNASRSVEGLRWRLNSLNKALGSIRKGNFGFVFARPETGKTTFLASEVTHMASQCARPILWLNNEQVGTEVMLRCYQAALGLDLTQLYSDLEGNRKRYHEATQGKIKLVDSASITQSQVEKLCAKYEPSLVVFDQIDKIKGFDNDREDLRLGSIYIWARELAKEHCPIIGVCQADGSGEGQRWLSMANVANAKTSKQAEADWILGIGKVNDVGYDNLRFMHLSKNKLPGDEDTDPQKRHDRWETLIEPMVGRYRDL